EWTECMLYAWNKLGVAAPLITRDGKMIVDIRLVTSKRKPGNSKSVDMDYAIREVCKYITKSGSWSGVPGRELLEMAEVRRWPRMVELLGDARQPGRSRARSDARDTSLDTTLLSDFENQPIDVEDPAKKVTKGRAPPLLDLPLDMDPQEWKRILKTRRVKQRS